MDEKQFVEFLGKIGIRMTEGRPLPYARAMENYGRIKTAFDKSHEDYLSEVKKLVGENTMKIPELNLIYFANFAWEARKNYDRIGISEKIYWDTMSDIRVWTEHCGRVFHQFGLMQTGWLQHHIKLLVFRLGRLQFEMGRFIAEKDHEQMEDQAPVLQVHIAEGEPLKHEECLRSYGEAVEFFRDKEEQFHFYPKAFLCYSWLMHPNLKKVLPPDSNIVLFQSDYEIIYEDPNDSQMLERVFGVEKKPAHLDELPRKTSLQRNILRFMENGGRIGEGEGLMWFPAKGREIPLQWR